MACGACQSLHNLVHSPPTGRGMWFGSRGGSGPCGTFPRMRACRRSNGESRPQPVDSRIAPNSAGVYLAITSSFLFILAHLVVCSSFSLCSHFVAFVLRLSSFFYSRYPLLMYRYSLFVIRCSLLCVLSSRVVDPSHLPDLRCVLLFVVWFVTCFSYHVLYVLDYDLFVHSLVCLDMSTLFVLGYFSCCVT